MILRGKLPFRKVLSSIHMEKESLTKFSAGKGHRKNCLFALKGNTPSAFAHGSSLRTWYKLKVPYHNVQVLPNF